MSREFEWDTAKARRNLELHKVAFEWAVAIFDGPTFEVHDTRRDYGEDRYIAMGLVDGRCLVVVHTPRGSKTRIISARKANRREQERYFAEVGGE